MPQSGVRPYIVMIVVVAVFIAQVVITFLLDATVVKVIKADHLKDLTGIIQSAVTSIAIVVAGLFAYNRLQMFRDFEPHLTISHKVSHRMIGDSYLHIDVTARLHNSSRVKIEVHEADFSIQQLAPATDEEIEPLYAQVFVSGETSHLQWPTLDDAQLNWDRGEMIVEPGESHHETYEFIVPSHVESVLVYTYFRNPYHARSTKSAEGWSATTIHDI